MLKEEEEKVKDEEEAKKRRLISQKLAWFMSLFRVFPDLYNKIYNLP